MSKVEANRMVKVYEIAITAAKELGFTPHDIACFSRLALRRCTERE